MHIFLVLIHVGSMIFSLGFMSLAVGLALLGKRSAMQLARSGFILTITGFLSGGLLLLDKPLSVQCAVLTSYLIGVTLLYRYGFAFGDSTHARLLKKHQA